MTDFNGGLLNDTLVYSIDEETFGYQSQILICICGSVVC